MSEICIDHDIHVPHFFYDGDVMCRGNFSVDTDVAITGKLMVLKDISIRGDCGVEELFCGGNIDIAGYLFCSKFSCSSDVKVGYSIK